MMTLKELKEYLDQFDEDTIIYISDGFGYFCKASQDGFEYADFGTEKILCIGKNSHVRVRE